MKQSFGNTVKALRKQCGLTQSDLAERLNVSPQAVSKWETGGCYPDISLLPHIADVFGVSTDMLLSHTTQTHDKEINAVCELADTLICKKCLQKRWSLWKRQSGSIPRICA